jgi:hypothetical protein
VPHAAEPCGTEPILFDRAQVERLDDLPDRPERLNGAKLL